MRGICVAIALAMLVGACSSLPDVEYSYYPAKVSVAITVTETITCTSGNVPVIVITPAAVSSYGIDTTQKDKVPYRVRIKRIEGAVGSFADSSAAFTFTDDGRLKGINQSTTGQGETILKSLATLATTLAVGGGSADKGAPPPTSDDCATIKTLGGDKGVTLFYNGTVESTHPGTPTFGIEPQSLALLGQIRSTAPPLQLTVNLEPVEPRAKFMGSADDSDIVPITLQKMANANIELLVKGAKYWTQTVPMPRPDTYVLPIPKAALFGQQSFSLALSDAGAIDSITYGKMQGAAGALNAINAGAGVEANATAARAAELKAQADVIAQTQRLAKCKATPTSCT